MSQSVILRPDENGEDPKVKLSGSDVQVPIDIQYRAAQTIQTHNAVSVALSSNSIEATWHDADGYDKIAATLFVDANINCQIDIQWSNDGSTWQATDALIVAGVANRRSGIIDVRARYFKFQVYNNDAALAHTMSAWAYLKV